MTPYVIGIDLGTTNSALAFWRDDADIAVLGVEQLTSPGLAARSTTLPSFIYVPVEGELTPAEARLPWDLQGQTDAVVGTWARDRGTLAPERLIASAKSWLGNGNVDRLEPVLPWKSEIKGKVSPVEASRRYLSHLIAAFEHDRGLLGESVDASQCQVVLTVPASFDEVARNLTYEAARRAGIASPVLLEEPLAAFYAWLGQDEKNWRQHVHPGDVVLICDVGGGTTDFSLVAVTEDDKGQLRLERVSVGDHLLLGGDNMDLTLAYVLKRDLEQDGRKLDHWQFLSLVGAARQAKERLLADETLDEVPISVASRGSSLFASTVSTRLTRAQVSETLVNGFLPLTAVGDMPQTRRSVGIQEFGLGYESDPAISRHLARFLRRSWQNVRTNEQLSALVQGRLRDEAQHLMPSAVLFNGGVFKAPVLRERVLELLKAWNGGEAVKELTGTEMELAVARGAAYYGKLRATGRGIRVQSGTARSYYVGLESPMPAVPGFEPPVKGLCLVPQGTDEGTEIELAGQQFGLIVGEPVEFRFFSSAVRAGDHTGTVIDDATSELEESARLSITLPAVDRREGDIVPVKLDAVVTEVGVLQLYMKDVTSDRKWNLEFNVRSHENA